MIKTIYIPWHNYSFGHIVIVTNIWLSYLGKFKSPSLRNIALTAPYMRDGSMKSLEEVIQYYDQGGNKNQYIDVKIFPLYLTQQEKVDLVAFMKTLTSQQPSK